ncbi:unnamed protein product [Acanthoscelides obtectus]|nr:unnamed protein product [Acanthoscelides obtectus]CAK1664330.1 5-methylcytosine rRNA methyltransferase NSUN4 [Acanthoscelides obtectus]
MFSYSVFKRVSQKTKQFVRYKHRPDHWSILRKKIHPIDKALNHMDDFYKQVFNEKWLRIRKAMLGKQKYVAVINNFGDDTEAMQSLELTGALNMRTLFSLEQGYIKEEKLKNMNNKAMDKILRLDEELEQKIQNKIEKEANESAAQEKPTASDFSLASSLEKAKFDTRRLIDIKDPLSTEALHEFLPATEIKGREDFIPESNHYKMYDPETHFSVKMEKEYDLPFPDHLNIYCYERDNKSDFDSPKRGCTDVFNYYLMDGGSILPILALDLRPGNRFLDMCSAPGGKSLLALQTFFPDVVVSNDSSLSRLNRVRSVYSQFLYDFQEKWVKTGKIRLTNRDGRIISEEEYDRILVDVPCTTDRHSLHENENNIFKPSRIKERLNLPELQKELLVNALKLVERGGIVVYSTCSLSPIQNDGVVHVALKQIWEETNMEFVVK